MNKNAKLLSLKLPEKGHYPFLEIIIAIKKAMMIFYLPEIKLRKATFSNVRMMCWQKKTATKKMSTNIYTEIADKAAIDKN